MEEKCTLLVRQHVQYGSRLANSDSAVVSRSSGVSMLDNFGSKKLTIIGYLVQIMENTESC